MADLPYTYTDDDGDRLHINHHISFIAAGSDVLSMEPPTGEDAVALARAILAAAGNTGHLVVSEDDRDESRRYIRILEAQRADLRQELRAAREVTGRLPEEDLAELRGWVERLDRDLSGTTKAVTQRLATVEARLGITESA